MIDSINVQFDNAVEVPLAFDGNRKWFDVIVPEGTERITVKACVALVDVHYFWHSDLSGGPTRQMEWRDTYTCGAQRNMPFIAFMNRSGELKAALATDDLWNDTEIVTAMNQEGCTYDVTFTMTRKRPLPTIRFYADCGGCWQDSLEVWRDAVKPAMPAIPEKAYDPVYCTWYAIHGAITEEWVETMVPEMVKLGLKTLILDDGWCYDDAKRVSPKTIVNWYQDVGNWTVSTAKFPDFKAHVARMRAQGVNYMVWVAPHLIGDRSEVHRAHPEWSCATSHEGCSYLKIESPDAVAFMKSRLQKLAVDNGLDGLKIDFLDIVAPDVAHPTGVQTWQFIKDITDALRTARPDALIEFRQAYATPVTLPFATQFRAGDVPFDWDLNFRRLVDLRHSIGNLAPVHADPAYWNPNETSENIARHLIAMMVGVPMLSMDLTALTERERTIIRFWLDFYERHREVINHGKWRFVYHSNVVSAAIAENETCKMVIVNMPGCEGILKAKDGKALFVLNLSDTSILLTGAKCHACDGVELAAGVIPVGGLGELQVPNK